MHSVFCLTFNSPIRFLVERPCDEAGDEAGKESWIII